MEKKIRVKNPSKISKVTRKKFIIRVTWKMKKNPWVPGFGN